MIEYLRARRRLSMQQAQTEYCESASGRLDGCECRQSGGSCDRSGPKVRQMAAGDARLRRTFRGNSCSAIAARTICRCGQ